MIIRDLIVKRDICKLELESDGIEMRGSYGISQCCTVLDVRRLRDALRDVLEEMLALKQQSSELRSSMHDKKDEARSRVEMNIGQLRSRKEECHKTAKGDGDKNNKEDICGVTYVKGIQTFVGPLPELT